MAEKAQINPTQKARWEAYIEESERFVALSSLIRTSVEAHIQNDHTEAAEPSPAIAGDVQDLQEELTEVRQNVAWLREYFQDDVDIADVARRSSTCSNRFLSRQRQFRFLTTPSDVRRVSTPAPGRSRY